MIPFEEIYLDLPARTHKRVILLLPSVYSPCPLKNVPLLQQDDLKVVENLDIPSDESGYLQKLCEDRAWGISVLFVDE